METVSPPLLITISATDIPPSPGARYFDKEIKEKAEEDAKASTLLKSIRAALQSSGKEPKPPYREVLGPADDDPTCGEEQLSWNENTIIWSTGGVQQMRFCFREEEQQIQYACFGWSQCTGRFMPGSSHGPFNSCESEHLPNTTISSDQPERETFSPFFRARNSHQQRTEEPTICRGIYVFLRNIGKILLLNGEEYTFSLPFIVRSAWPLSSHGVLIQRVLDEEELEEAEVEGDSALPTLFSLTNPFSEPRAAGIANNITGGYDLIPPLLKEHSKDKSIDFVPADEHVIWVSNRSPTVPINLVASVNASRTKLTLWHYACIQPADAELQAPMAGPSTAPGGGEHRRTASVNIARDPVGSRVDRIRSPSPDPFEPTQSADLPDMPVMAAMPGMPGLSAVTATLTFTGSSGQLPQTKGRCSSLSRSDLTSTMDRMALGRRSDVMGSAPTPYGRIVPEFWMESLHVHDLTQKDTDAWKDISVSLFDKRFDGKSERVLLALCLPGSRQALIYTLTSQHEKLRMMLQASIPAVSTVAVEATRERILDLLIATPGGDLALLTQGLHRLELDIRCESVRTRDPTQNEDVPMSDASGDRLMTTEADLKLVSLKDPAHSFVTATFADGQRLRLNMDLRPKYALVQRIFFGLSGILSPNDFFSWTRAYLLVWSTRNRPTNHMLQYRCLTETLLRQIHLDDQEASKAWREESATSPWSALFASESHFRLFDDAALVGLDVPQPRHVPMKQFNPRPNALGLYLRLTYVFHAIAEEMRLDVSLRQDLTRMVSLLCRIAHVVVPEYVEYWKRLFPDCFDGWPKPVQPQTNKDSYYPVQDLTAALYTFLTVPERALEKDKEGFFGHAGSSFAYGRVDIFESLRSLEAFYAPLGDLEKLPECRKRAEQSVLQIVKHGYSPDFLNRLPLAIATPLREASRTCQLGLPIDWPLAAYDFVGRNDLTEGVNVGADMIFNDGYRSIKDHIDRKTPRKTFKWITDDVEKALTHSHDTLTGVELGLADFMEIRFGQDRRVQEVARMLCSATVPSIKMADRPELTEHELAKEQQAQVLRTAERTLALPLGRAMFTFGSVPAVLQEVYPVPKIELSVRLQPANTVIAPEPGKISAESMSWAEFHNGVAAALRISPTSATVDSSWIAFQKPAEHLTPEHAGLLFGLGLTGHLKEMLTWHTFAYLTPKHDLTSIGVLLGLSAANVGTSNRHVTKLLAVHTPALLPTQGVDLNVPLLTQAAGLVGCGLLYMGTKNRRMAEVALHQISRKDLLQPDLTNEHREAYTMAAALAFGMIMLGRGTITSSPADAAILARLRVLIHGEAPTVPYGKVPNLTFDVHITSPAASIALGLMYLRTDRRDIADILTIPDTALALNHIEPSFLLVRTLARALIMWNVVQPTNEWIVSQVPSAISQAMEAAKKHHRPADESVELAFHHIIAGCCFALGLKFAGTAREEAYMKIIQYYDHFTRAAHPSSVTFDHKIRRAALRDGLNLISLSLNMIMAGTGEINCLRRLRFAHGMHATPVRYGAHMATHMSLGLLFLGGGRYTLGNSNAAIACLVAAFFPRFPALSSDNKGYLQALRHLWVLAVEPRCLVARDVDTKEVVYLPMKIRIQEGSEVVGAQLISPTLIPGLDRLRSIKVDTPRYWPYFLDIANNPRHRHTIIQSQTIFVKRRTMFLSYLEDPKGSRSLFVRSGMSTGDAATLDNPQLTDTKVHPAGDLQYFITSFSNDSSFTSFADRFCRGDGITDAERTFNAFCHAALLDCIIQDKPQILSAYLQVYRVRVAHPRSRYFQLLQQDVRLTGDFYTRLFERRFSGRTDGILRPPLLRENTVLSALRAADKRLRHATEHPDVASALHAYVRGERESPHLLPGLDAGADGDKQQLLCWYLVRHSVPTMAHLVTLRALAQAAFAQFSERAPPEGTHGTSQEETLEEALKLVLHTTGGLLVRPGGLWTLQSLEDILYIWRQT